MYPKSQGMSSKVNWVPFSLPLRRSRPTISARSDGGGHENFTVSPVHGCLKLKKENRVEEAVILAASFISLT